MISWLFTVTCSMANWEGLFLIKYTMKYVINYCIYQPRYFLNLGIKKG